MSLPHPPKTRTYYALILHPTARQLLLVPAADGWEPPSLRSPDPDVFAGGPLDTH